jgi:hypothetical protein
MEAGSLPIAVGPETKAIFSQYRGRRISRSVETIKMATAATATIIRRTVNRTRGSLIAWDSGGTGKRRL